MTDEAPAVTPRAVPTVNDLEVTGRRVLLRVDFNVPMHEGSIVDDRRIRAALPTIRSLRDRGARVVVVTHLGRPKGTVKPELTVAPLARHLGELLGIDVPVATDVVGESARQLVAAMHDGDVVMLENVRFEPGEEANDPAMARQLAALADVYVNDAFGTAHRAHASTEGVAHLLPSAAGLLMARELEALGSVLNDARPPVVAILGGAKVSSKLGVLTNLMERVDDLFIGGAMACTFLRAQGLEAGRSALADDQVDVARGVLEHAQRGRCTLHLPVDVVVAESATEGAATEVVPCTAIPAERVVVDIGPLTVAAIAAAVGSAGTVVWNGPLGIYEIDAFGEGTRAVARELGKSSAKTVVGGGDLAAALDRTGLSDGIDWVSTGGGATLEYLEGRQLPGVVALTGSVSVH
ncbi:MAG: phosphoglycerate kinase [Candidatus Dormibacteraeota bacterium]|nr:phosphoglycerate kinase [Candidatus Dormibacteraeota bacterium]